MHTNRHLVTGAVIATTLVLPLASQAKSLPLHQAFEKKMPVAAQKVAKKQIDLKKLPEGNGQRNGITGTVSAISGSTLTVTGTNNTTYTIDASNAKSGEFFTQQNDPLSYVVVGDKISAFGALNGTALTASIIRDLDLNGRNIFSGTITAINGNTLTLKSRNATYDVNASGAAISQWQRPASKGAQPTQKSLNFSDLKTNDRITVAGTLNGSTVTAANIQELGRSTHDVQSEVWGPQIKQAKKK